MQFEPVNEVISIVVKRAFISPYGSPYLLGSLCHLQNIHEHTHIIRSLQRNSRDNVFLLPACYTACYSPGLTAKKADGLTPCRERLIFGVLHRAISTIRGLSTRRFSAKNRCQLFHHFPMRLLDPPSETSPGNFGSAVLMANLTDTGGDFL